MDLEQAVQALDALEIFAGGASIEMSDDSVLRFLAGSLLALVLALGAGVSSPLSLFFWCPNS